MLFDIGMCFHLLSFVSCMAEKTIDASAYELWSVRNSGADRRLFILPVTLLRFEDVSS